jgi:NADPH:quinone reductase-like Zn-dependent oxidoreductase
MTMRIVEFGGSGFDALRFAERPVPTVAPGQIRLRVKATALNFRDVLACKGQIPVIYPRIPLSDAAGEVVEIGTDVSRVAVGDRGFVFTYIDAVAGYFQPMRLALDRGVGECDGVACEYIVIDEDEFVPVPDFLSDIEAATLACAGLTAWSAVTIAAGLKPGARVVVQGTGGVSLFALQFALLAGAEVYLTSSSDEKLARGQALGAHHLINYRNTPDWDEVLLERTGGHGADLIVDVVGGDNLARSVNAVARRGHISLVGVQAGWSGVLPILPAMIKEARIDGVISASRGEADAMMRAITVHRLRPVIDRVFAFEQLGDALRYLESGAHFGKVVVDIPLSGRGS